MLSKFGFIRKLSHTTLKKRIIFLMGAIVTITPTILVAILALSYYYLGIETIFNDKVNVVVADTVKVAELYLNEHKENIRSDLLGIANNIYKNYYLLVNHPELYQELIDKQAELRNLSGAMILTKKEVIARTQLSSHLFFERIPEDAYQLADKGEVVILATNLEDRVQGFIKLDSFGQPVYLLAERFVDKSIINHLKTTQGSASLYQKILHDIHKTRLHLGIIFLLSSVLLCMGAILIAMKLAHIISQPINQLVEATTQIKAGNYSIRVPEKYDSKDEITILSRAFNDMTMMIEKQTNELLSAKDIIDERRRFIETVLRELSSGVLVIDTKDNITLLNQSALALFNINRADIIGKRYYEYFSELSDIINETKRSPQNLISRDITVDRDDKKCYFLIRAIAETNTSGAVYRYIVTIDDMSQLVIAQRAAAWSDVARRIAHEIKNPLTPIHLAAEQLKRKFLKEINTDQNTFSRYINTIITHVDDIGAMVEDFVQFARIRAPKMEKNDIALIISAIIFSQRNIHPDISYSFDKSAQSCYALCDRAQISQVLLNILKNSGEAVESKKSKVSFQGKVNIICYIKEDQDLIVVSIFDNGGGIPKEIIDRVSEPYVTTKKNGTGLGLSIVKKIIEEHGGTFSVSNIEEGAGVSFSLKLYNPHKGEAKHE